MAAIVPGSVRSRAHDCVDMVLPTLPTHPPPGSPGSLNPLGQPSTTMWGSETPVDLDYNADDFWVG